MIFPDLTTRPHRMTVERAMAAAPHDLFRAWTEQIDRWFAAPGTALITAQVDAPFFFETQVQGERHAHYGRFLKLDPGRLVELTWITAGGTRGAETVITIDLVPQGRGTRLRLTHAGFPDDELMRRHEQAWPIVLDQLDKAYPASS